MKIRYMLCMLGILTISTVNGTGKYAQEAANGRRSEYSRAGAAYREQFLNELSRFVSREDSRRTEIELLSTRCILDRDSSACIQMQAILIELWRSAQIQCMNEALDPAFAIAQEILAIDELLPNAGEREVELSNDRTSLSAKLEALLQQNCSLCFTSTDYYEFMTMLKKNKAGNVHEACRIEGECELVRNQGSDSLELVGLYGMGHSPFSVLIARSKIMVKAVEEFNAGRSYDFRAPTPVSQYKASLDPKYNRTSYWRQHLEQDYCSGK